MPLSAGLPILKNEIESAYIKVKNSGSQNNASHTSIIKQLSNDLGTAIHKYMETALVTTQITVDPGAMNAAGSPAATAVPTASYVTPGNGTGTGTISFKSPDIQSLISSLEKAFLKVEKSSEKNEANPDLIIATLAADLKVAIDTFALTALVETETTINPGQIVTGYMAIAGPATVPVPATSLLGTGKGKGDPAISEGLS